ncbi:MAG: C-terminal binding protein [Litorimonas sp.]
MTHVVLIDPQFQDNPDVEREVLPEPHKLDIVRLGEQKVDGKMFQGADAIVNCRSRHGLSEDVVNSFDTIKIIVQSGVGYDHIDLAACGRRGIPVCNTPDYGTMEVADHAIGLTLSLCRGIPAYDQRLHLRDDAWQTMALPVPPIRRLRTQTFGVIGLGRIGLATALRAKAFQMRVVFFDPYLPPGAELAVGLERMGSLDDLLGQSDIVSIHTPLSPLTNELINHEAIEKMKDNAILINTGRGKTVNLDAVEAGLRSGKLCAAGLDVLPVEPLDRSHPLIAAWTAREDWLEGRLVITPHAAFYSPESLRDIRRLAMQAVIDYLPGGKLRSCVNLEYLQDNGFFVERRFGQHLWKPVS